MFPSAIQENAENQRFLLLSCGDWDFCFGNIFRQVGGKRIFCKNKRIKTLSWCSWHRLYLFPYVNVQVKICLTKTSTFSVSILWFSRNSILCPFNSFYSRRRRANGEILPYNNHYVHRWSWCIVKVDIFHSCCTALSIIFYLFRANHKVKVYENEATGNENTWDCTNSKRLSYFCSGRNSNPCRTDLNSKSLWVNVESQRQIV